MPALKDIGQMSSLIGLSTLKTSPLWNMEIQRIHITQLHAFIRLAKEVGQKDQAETAVQIAINEVTAAVGRGELERPRMLDYSPPEGERMTAGELIDGLKFMGPYKASAVVFALECGMSAQAVARLTWVRAMQMFQAGVLTPLAIRYSQACPRQLHLQYVFWEMDPTLGKARPLLSLDADVFDAFGLLWGELEERYKRLIPIVSQQDERDLRGLLTRLGAVLPPLADDGLGPAHGAGR